MAIRIPIIADVVDAIRGARRLGESFDDVADALEDVDRSAADATGGTRDLERGFDGVAGALRDVDRAAGTADDAVAQVGAAADGTGRDAAAMEAKFRDAFDAVRKESRAAGDAVGDNLHDGADRAGDGVRELGEEANSTAREAAASFDGSAQSIGDAFQEVAANAFAGFGPAGALAGLAAAAGIGVVFSKLDEAEEKAQDTAEAVAELAGQLIDLGKNRRGPAEVNDALADMAGTAEDGKNSLTEVGKAAADAGIDFRDYARGLAGDEAALRKSYDEVSRALGAYFAQVQDLTDTTGRNSSESIRFRSEMADQVTALFKAKDALLEQDSTLDQATEATELYRRATSGTVDAQKEAEAATSRRTDAIDAQRSALADAGDAETVFSETQDRLNTAAEEAAKAQEEAAGRTKDAWKGAAEDVPVSLDELIATLNSKVAENASFEANLTSLAQRGYGALADELRAGGPEANGATTALLAAGTDAQVQAYATAQGSLLGSNLVAGAAASVNTAPSRQLLSDAVAGAVKGIPVPSFNVKVQADLTPAEAQLEAFRRKLSATGWATLRPGVSTEV